MEITILPHCQQLLAEFYKPSLESLITILPHCPQLLAEFYKPDLSTKLSAFLCHIGWKPKNSLGFLSTPKNPLITPTQNYLLESVALK